MGYINNTLKRASIQSLREYFLYGVSDETCSAKSYEMRIKKAYERWHNITAKYEKEGEDSELETAFRDALREHEHVYMELGIQAGFQLAREIDRSEEDQELYSKYKEMYSSLFQDTTKAIELLQKAQRNAEDIYCNESE